MMAVVVMVRLMTTYDDRHVGMVDDIITDASHKRSAQFSVTSCTTKDDVSTLCVCFMDHCFARFPHDIFYLARNL
jgi:hypothetical protein